MRKTFLPLLKRVMFVGILGMLSQCAVYAQVSAPVFTPSGGEWGTTQTVAISSSGATTIYYTTDGNTPTANDNLYSSPVLIGASLILKAIGVNGSNSSPVTTGTYAITGDLGVGASHVLALGFNRTVMGWGANGSGQLGNDNITTAQDTAMVTATDTAGDRLPNVVSVLGGISHSLFLKGDGTVWAAGDNSYAQLGQGTHSGTYDLPVEVLSNSTSSALQNIETIGCGANFGVAVAESGTAVYAWGENSDGEAGVGESTSATINKAEQVRTSNTGPTYLSDVIQVSAGNQHAVAVTGSGTVFSWGGNADGEMALPSSTTMNTVARQISSLSSIIGVGGGGHSVFAITSSNTVMAWGYNAYGALGIGNTTSPIRTPTAVTTSTGGSFANVVQVDSSTTHTLFLKGDGTVWASGSNSYGELGNGSTTRSTYPVQVMLSSTLPLTNIVVVGAGNNFSAALSANGTVYTWGHNGYGELCNGSTTTGSTNEYASNNIDLPSTEDVPPTITLGLTDPQSVQPASVVLTPSVSDSSGLVGNVRFYNGSFYLGTATEPNLYLYINALTTGTYSFTAFATDIYGATSAVSNIETFIVPLPSLSLSEQNPSITETGGIDANFVVMRSGSTTAPLNISYNIGGTAVSGSAYVALTGTTSIPEGNSTVDVPVIPMPSRNFQWQSANVTLTLTGTAYNAPSASGTISITNLPPVGQPTLMPASSTFLAARDVLVSDTASGVSVGYTTNGSTPTGSSPTVDSGNLVSLPIGTGTLNTVGFETGYPYSFTTTGTYTGIAMLAAGAYHSLALRSDGTVWAWGANNQGTTNTGQLGMGTFIDQWYPTQVSMPLHATTIAAGSYHSLAVDTFGNVWSWGSNSNCQLGNSGPSSDVPAPVSGARYAIAVAGGAAHSVVLTSTGAILTWGYDNDGQLGNGAYGGSYPSLQPVVISDTSGIVAVAAGSYFTTALAGDGNVWAWGDNSFGEDGQGTTSGLYDIPTKITNANISNIVAIADGDYHVLALRNDGTVWSWGSNSQGQLGGYSGAYTGTPVEVLTSSGTLTGVTAIAAGTGYSIAIKNDGSVWTWGCLGNGSLGGASTHIATQLSGVSGDILAAASLHALISGSNGIITALGLNTNGELGTGNNVNSTTPLISAGQLLVPPPKPTFSPDTGSYSGTQQVVITCTNSLATIYYTLDGSLPGAGNGNTITSGQSIPINQTTVLRASSVLNGVTSPPKSAVYNMGYQLVAGAEHSMLLNANGSVYTWGSNSSGQLGLGWGSDDQVYPQLITLLSGTGTLGLSSTVSEISAGPVNSAAVVNSGTNSGTVWVWGDNTFAQVGYYGSFSIDSPVQISGLSGFIATACGQSHILALSGSGTVWAWGNGLYGQLGNGSTNDSATPVEVTGLTGIKAVAAGNYSSYALSSTGTVYAWGDNYAGALGINSYSNANTPIQIPGLTNIVAITASGYSGFALRNDGTVWAWGFDGSDLLADDINTTEIAPVQVGTMRDVVAISIGENHGLAVRGDGTVLAWGTNSNFDLEASATNPSLPVPISGISLTSTATVFNTMVSAGSDHSLVVMTTAGVQTLWAWGLNSNGQLADGTLTSRYAPELVQYAGYPTSDDGLPNWLAIELGISTVGSGLNGEGVPYGIANLDGEGLDPGLPYTPYQLPTGNPNNHTAPTITITIPIGATLQ